MVELANQLLNSNRLRLASFPRIRTHVEIYFETEQFRVKTVDHTSELLKVLQLRSDVFLSEVAAKKSETFDFDKFDLVFDHIGIFEKASGRCVGTYRLNASGQSKIFYSETEFDLEELRKLQDPVLELGRACVAADHRNGAIIQLLWKGIAAYMRATNSRYLLGCSSVFSEDPEKMSQLSALFEKQGYLSPLRAPAIRPLPKVGVDHIFLDLGQMIPGLFMSYLKMGAKICGGPAWDRDMHCSDFLTLLDINDLPPFVRKRYGL